jgi:4-amino-4-deoxy-L-arabinose transferase-like glycosyltransferase
VSSPLSPRTLKPLHFWIAMLCILAVYVFDVERCHPTNFFGRWHDDSIYFSTAKALAQGQGYVIASFPGSPPQTKYPILFPWLLSWIWKLNPNFPENLKDAVRLTEFFGCWSLVAAFFVLRELPGIGEKQALCITALCAFQPVFLHLSGVIMSDVPFMALGLTVLALGDRVTRSGASPWLVIAAGAVAGLSAGMRTLGVAVIGGILLLALFRRAYREAIVFGLVAGVVVLAVSWTTMIHPGAVQTASASNLESGWNQVLAYYTNYAQFQWRMGVPNFWYFLDVVKMNFMMLLTSPGPMLIGLIWRVLPVSAVLSFPIWLGISRQYRRAEWQPGYFVFALYLAIVILWPFPQPERYLLPMLPFLFAGLWLELERLGPVVRANLRGGVPFSQRLAATLLATILMATSVFGAWNYLVAAPRRLQLASATRSRALGEQKEAYEWIRQHTEPGDRFAAYSDVVLFLYTGRQALRPVEFLPIYEYVPDTRFVKNDLLHVADAARHVGAKYWLRTERDFELEQSKDLIDARLAEIDAALPVVFRNQNNTAWILDASCLTDAQRPECRDAQRVLFPAEGGEPVVGRRTE